jgi:hypothetical protein
LLVIIHETRPVKSGEAIVIEPLLYPGDALVVDVDEADQMRDLVAGGIAVVLDFVEPVVARGRLRPEGSKLR